MFGDSVLKALTCRSMTARTDAKGIRGNSNLLHGDATVKVHCQNVHAFRACKVDIELPECVMDVCICSRAHHMAMQLSRYTVNICIPSELVMRRYSYSGIS